MTITQAHWDRFLAAMAEADQPRALFRELEAITKETVGTLLFTVMTFDAATASARRLYSDNETAYPTGGYKPMSMGKWYDIVFKNHQPFSSLTIEEVAEVFHDWELIQSLGLGSGCNIPVILNGGVIGTLNLMDRTGYYTAERVAQAMELRPMIAIALLAALEYDAAGSAAAPKP